MLTQYYSLTFRSYTDFASFATDHVSGPGPIQNHLAVVYLSLLQSRMPFLFLLQTVTLLKNTGHLFHRMALLLGFSAVSL